MFNASREPQSTASLMFPTNPTVQDIFRARIFEEPLVPIGTDPSADENTAFATALLGFSKRSDPEDFCNLTGFVDANPKSPWNAALLTNLGLVYYRAGRYSKALDAWSNAYDLSRAVTHPAQKPLADRAIGELAYMLARLGRMAELGELLSSVEGRAFCGPATEKIAGAREGLVNMQARPEISFRCGPLALHRIKLAVHPDDPQSDLIDASESTQQGFSLHQVAELSHTLGLDYQMAFRDKGAEFIAPSVLHFKVDHFAAMIRREDDRYLLQDPTFKNDAWVTEEALEAEASGYFLIPPGDLPNGWRAVEEEEAGAVWGRGNTPNPPDPPGSGDPTTESNPCPKKGMATARAHLLNVSLNITDEPVGYSPPIGPAVRFTVRYNQRDNQFSSTFNYSNFGPKWTFDWLAYILDDPSNPLGNVTYYMPGGGNRTFTAFDSASRTYAFQLLDQTKLIRTSSNSYEMLSRDGTRMVFGQSDGGVATRRCFLTKRIDSFGNAVTLTYDSNFRIVAITDAIGQVTVLEYGIAADIFKITKVTDPFGRSATFGYNLSKQLTTITDVIGLSSEFAYESDASDFITTLTTPYGATTFTKSENGTTRSLEMLYPDGERERVEFNQDTSLGIPASDPPQSVPGGMATRNEFLAFRNTYHWDRQGCAHAYGDHAKARIYHWLHSTDMRSPVGILESVKQPLEGRVWNDYGGQSTSNGSIAAGSTSKPTHVGRVLDDGSTQLYSYEYNDFGNVTKTVDPVGRTFSFQYAENGIDLLETRQTRLGQSELLLQITYNAQHLPLTSKDAAGQTTTLTYNARGQVLTETNARGDTTTYHYDANGYRTAVDGPLGAGDTTTWTYDAFGRVRTKSDVSGYTLAFDYDDLDRPTKITYPDATFDQFTYTLLDRTLVQDRAGRKTSFEFNRVRQMTKRTDPLNRATLFEWCKCGALRRLTDPMGRTTTWQHDVQGRVKCKEYADGSRITYLYENTTSRTRQRIDEKLQVTQFNYNRDNTLGGKIYTNAAVATPAVAFAYDANYPRLISMTDGIGKTRYRYIPITPIPALGAGQLASEAGPLPNDTLTYEYDEMGRRVSMAINGLASSVTFDPAGRITSATNALGTFDYTYEGSSFRQTTQSYPNGQTSEWSYAGNLQDQSLQRITHRNGATPISEFIYRRDVPTEQVTSWSQQSETRTPSIYNFSYDAADRLISATLSPSPNVGPPLNYSYDTADNLTSINGSPAAYNNVNQIVSVSGTAYAYDANGNLTHDGIHTYQWDAENRLVGIGYTGDPGKYTAMRYDGLGRRVSIREKNGPVESETNYSWCGDTLCKAETPAGVTRRYYSQGEARPLTGEMYYYSLDHLGSVRDVGDATVARLLNSYEYGPYGDTIALNRGGVSTDFRYAGMFYHDQTGLYLTRFRIYDSRTARWLSRDPIEERGGFNLYSYVGNNPIDRIDPDGADWRRWCKLIFLIYKLRNPMCDLLDPGECHDPGDKISDGEERRREKERRERETKNKKPQGTENRVIEPDAIPIILAALAAAAAAAAYAAATIATGGATVTMGMGTTLPASLGSENRDDRT